jgi:transposase
MMRVYEKDFKEEAIKLANEVGTSRASEQLGVPTSTLSGWKTSKLKYKENAFSGSGKERIIPSNATEVRLMKKIKELERANDILKEALGFFARSQKR